MFSKHIPSLYSPKPTLATLYADDNTLFASMQFPEGLDAATVGAFLLHRYGSLDTIYKEADEAKAAFGLWAGIMLPGWEKIWAALQEEYKPLENYSMLEKIIFSCYQTDIQIDTFKVKRIYKTGIDIG